MITSESTGPIDDKPKVSCFGRPDTVLTGNFDSFILYIKSDFTDTYRYIFRNGCFEDRRLRFDGGSMPWVRTPGIL